MLDRLDPKYLHILYRIAKDPRKGITLFFTNPHNMIALRNAVVHTKTPIHTGATDDTPGT